MKIIAHRGFWLSEIEKNSINSFIRSWNRNFSVETDLRDHNGEVVISHDLPCGAQLTLNELITAYKKYVSADVFLALNIKADGLAKSIKKIIDLHGVTNYFVFDMSVPDIKSYFDLEIPFFTRMSDVESAPVYFDKSSGVWLDSFFSDWFDESVVDDLLESEKKVCVVSPELHNRDYSGVWNNLKKFSLEENVFLCTDYPDKAKIFFEKTLG